VQVGLRPGIGGSSASGDSSRDTPFPEVELPLTTDARQRHAGSRLEAAVTAGGKHVAGPHEAWIEADPARSDVRVIITGPLGFERRVAFAMNDEPSEINRRVRQTIEAET
jgi:hypothetical protein